MKESMVNKVVQKKDNTGGYHSWTADIKGVTVLFWTWQVAFNNSDWGEFNVKDGHQPKFVVGESAHYTIEVNKYDSSYPAVIKHVNPEYQDRASNSTPTQVIQVEATNVDGKPYVETPQEKVRSIVRQKAIECASRFHATRSGVTDIMVTDTADAYYDWVMKPERVEAKEMVNDALTQEFKQAVLKDEDDLPF